jgi:holliday junction resolvase YEN1
MQEMVGLSPGGLLLFASLSGGDYDNGVEGCGAITALGLAKCGFGDQLLASLKDHQCGDLSDADWNSFLI